MKKPLLTLGRVVLTLLVVTFACVVVWRMTMYYMFAPWTRDAHIRADIVQIAPDVSGLIKQVDVRDNQPVSRDQVLFVIDQERFKLALRQAEATVADRKETLAQAQRESRRNKGLGNLVAREQLEESQSREMRAQAALIEAQVAVDSAQLNLDRTVVRSPVDGYVNDRAPRVNEFVTACGRSCRSSTAARSISTAILKKPNSMASMSAKASISVSLVITHVCAGMLKALWRASKTVTAPVARTCCPTSTLRSAGCDWRNGFRYASCLTTCLKTFA